MTGRSAGAGTGSDRSERPLVIAHRGASGSRPENTLSAYELAVEQGSDMIEIDLHRTRDGEIVITHDEDLTGLGGQGEIADATFVSVRALDAGDGQHVPTLDEVLDGFGARIPFNLELKRGTRIEYPELEAMSLDAVERRDLLDETLFSSFYDPILERLRARAPRARIGALVSPRFPERWLDRARAVQAEAVHLHLLLANADNVAAAHGEGLAVHVYTVDAPDAMRRVVDLGVDGIFTNHPERLRGLLEHEHP